MRLLKKRSPSPPQLIRLATLPGEDATHGSLSTKVCFSLPNIPSLSRLQDMPGAAETSTKPIRVNTGFSLPRAGRKQFTPLKYAVSVETAHPSRVDQPSLDCGSSQWTRPNVDHRQKDFTTSLSNMWGSERWVGLDAENRETQCEMYRSISTSALLGTESQSEDEHLSNSLGRKSSYLPTKTVSYEDLSDKLCPLDGAANQLMKAKSQLGTVFEEEVYLGKLPQEPGELGNGQAINRLFVAEDTTSLASSIQHRSDESGYESDGTKNGSDESSNSEDKRQPFVIETDVPLVIAKNSISTSLSLRTSVKRTESKENCSLRTCVKRTESKENCSLRTGVKRAESKENCSLRTGVKRAESKENCSLRTSAKRAESKENCSLRIGVKRAESKENCSLRTSVKRAESKENCICSPQKTSDGNLQRFSAILQKLKTQNSGSSSTSRTASSASQNRVHSSSDGRACGDARSLRLRTPGILSQLVLKCKDDRTGKNDTRGSSTKCDPKTETSRLGQFKAWTLDRRLLRKTKKGTHHSDHQKADRLSPKRTSLFESSLCLDTVQESSDVSGPATNHLDHSELGTSEEVDDGGVISKLHLCGDLNYQLKLKKAGHKMSSTNNDTRRQWLQPQLNTKSNPKEKESKGAMFYWGNGPNKDSFTFKLPVADCNLDSDTELREPEKCDNTELVFTTKHSGLENTTKQKVFSVVLEKDEQGELGIYINRQEEERNVVGYVVAALEEGGPACRNGQLQAGDELLTVNGKQLQGVNLEEAQRLLRTFKTTVKLLVSRKVPSNRFCTLSRPSSSQLFTYSVAFEKGPGCKNLGFSIVGGKDSPKGDMGIFVKTVFSTGQAVESGKIMEGDEILMVNGQPLQGMVHSEAIATFRNIKQGTVLLRVGRRTSVGRHGIRHVSKSCSNLDRLS